MRQRLPLLLSATALVVALFGSTPLGSAADRVLAKVPYAGLADVAKNAQKLNGHTSATKPKAGQIPVLDATGKLPAALGAIGPKGDTGPKGDPGAKGDKGPQGDAGARGAPGISDYKAFSFAENVPTGKSVKQFNETCPGGRSALGAGYYFKASNNNLDMYESYPVTDDASKWHFSVTNTTGEDKTSILLFVVCARVSS
jgi:hypothetical protein